MTVPAPPCSHCHGSGRCDQPCCTTFGFKVLQAIRRGGQVIAGTAPACASCRGSGQARQG